MYQYYMKNNHGGARHMAHFFTQTHLFITCTCGNYKLHVHVHVLQIVVTMYIYELHTCTHVGPGGWNDFDFLMTGGQVRVFMYIAFMLRSFFLPSYAAIYYDTVCVIYTRACTQILYSNRSGNIFTHCVSNTICCAVVVHMSIFCRDAKIAKTWIIVLVRLMLSIALSSVSGASLPPTFLWPQTYAT